MPWGPLLGPRAETPGCLSAAADLHCQGAVFHLLPLGRLRALQHPLQDRRHPAGILQPAHRHGNLRPAPAAASSPCGASLPFGSVLPWPTFLSRLKTGRDGGTGISRPGLGLGLLGGHPAFSQDLGSASPTSPCRKEEKRKGASPANPSTLTLSRECVWGGRRLVLH